MFHYLSLFLNIPEKNYFIPAVGAMYGALIILGLLIGLVVLIGVWKVFTKAGRPGWAVFVPLYNLIVLLDLNGRPWWWLLLFLIPILNVVIFFITMLDLAKSFGKGIGFAMGLIFLLPIFFMVLGFGRAVYVGPACLR